MLTLLKLIQSLASTLHSEGTPTQVALGIALGAALGLTPLMSAHNLLVVAIVCVFNVSVGGAMLGWLIFTPVGFLLDPLFDALGRLLLVDTPSLQGLWTSMYNAPLVPFTNFNNTVVLGSFVSWVVLFVPIFLLARVGVERYRATWGERVRQSAAYRAISASRAYNLYKLFRP
ncbi:MAG TPA: TIGR03546 family protein [Gemmatimonadaceae bacterium]|nr:TIGR03546 family protein [Gemmatimonadaceae bacterium]